MKTINYYWSIFAFVALLFTSCTTEETAVDTSPEAKNSAELTFGALLDNLANRSMNKDHFSQVPTCSDAEPDMAMVTFSYPGSGGDKVVEVGISEDSDGYFTEYSELLKIPIAQGAAFTKVTLKGFRVYDSSDNLIWVAPIAPGDFAGYITKPLPFDVDVYANSKPYIDVEVLCFDRRDVNEYGYPFFDLVPGKIYPLCFFANLCVGDRHFVGNYTLDLYYDDGTGRIQLYTSGDANAMPNTGVLANNNYFADPLCLEVPDKPEGFLDSQDYLFYVITPKDWTGNYGDVDNTPLAEEGLSWNDVNALLNADGETNEYIHVFIGCDVIPGCIPGVSTAGDLDGDCIPNDDDNCPTTYNPGQADGDDDGVGDVCDECPTRAGTEANGCPQNEPCIGSDPDGDGFFGLCDNCPEEYSLTNNGCPVDACIADSDGDGLNDCIDGCPSEYSLTNNGCPETTPPSGCGTAFMFGDTEINDISNSNRWGWAENFNTDDGATQTFDFWRGAGQNDTSKGVKAGTVTITATGDQVQFTINLASGFSISDLHVYLSEEQPGNTAKSPGKYNRNDEVGDSETSFTLTRTSDDDSFWVIVHAGDTCN
ncbi:thrombospondin type 3 repeat-containing protein [Gillisia hiemivivida]|uniref:Uncharacterized protein n=1 Tax=Gillisia hiemivivida TaxID=291190 RepID=A0A5C6ZWS9_9FLAO|nr:thrombospondin type 3 repeat-containing protein [Gillisia hiemivivida]TXD94463.1 hypothetical protein ES724_05480 [Gillisia hiemivivida]